MAPNVLNVIKLNNIPQFDMIGTKSKQVTTNKFLLV